MNAIHQNGKATFTAGAAIAKGEFVKFSSGKVVKAAAATDVCIGVALDSAAADGDIIPVPLHWTRRWRRGYNQAEILAKAVAEAFSPTAGNAVPVVCRPGLLVRSRRTRTQTRLNVEQKARNVEAAFRVPERAVRILSSARHILLIDDTFTTGATLYACYAALRPFTSARISVATLAAVEGTPSLPHERPSGPALSPSAPAGTREPTKTI